MAIDVRIRVDGLENVMQRLRRYEFRANELVPGLRRAGQVIVRSVDKNFEAQGRPNKWKSRSDLTRMYLESMAEEQAKTTKRYQNMKRESTRQNHLAKVRETVRNGPILQNSGDLRKSITFQVVDDKTLMVGSSLRYAAIHHFGGVIRPKNSKALYVPVGGGQFLMLKRVVIPARPYLMIQSEDEPKIEQAMLGYIAGDRE